MSIRFQPDRPPGSGTPGSPGSPGHPTPQRAPARFNLLLTQDRAHALEHWTFQLPRLLEPQRVYAYVAGSADEALALTSQIEIHAAVIDLGTPTGRASRLPARGEGVWLLELFRRLPKCPPMVVVQSPSQSRRELERVLQDALRLGAFSVVRKPVELEQILAVLSRLVDRAYQGQWPSTGSSS